MPGFPIYEMEVVTLACPTGACYCEVCFINEAYKALREGDGGLREQGGICHPSLAGNACI